MPSGPRWAVGGAASRAGTPPIWPPSRWPRLLARNDLDPALVEDVIMGCTMTVGEQAMNIARNAALAAGFPESVPGTTVDRQCGSAQQAIHFAAQAVMSGAMDIAIGAGVESMSRVPIGSTTEPGPGEAYGPLYTGALRADPPGRVRRGDRPALEDRPRGDGRVRPAVPPTGGPGHRRGAVRDEIVPLEARVHPDVPGAADVTGLLEATRASAATPRWRSWRDSPGLLRGGTVTAGTSSQISDGAAAVLIMSEERARRWGCGPGPVSTPSRWRPTTRRSC